MHSRRRARLLLLLTVLIWGTSFVVVKSALADASPLIFNLLRMSLASAVLVTVNWRALRQATRPQWLAGAAAGLFLAAGYQFQTLGLVRTTAVKSALITGLVVILVPLLALVPGVALRGRRESPWLSGFGALIAFAGLVLLTTPAGASAAQVFSANPGDILTLLCAVAFAFHLLLLSRVSKHVHAGVLAATQIGSAALLMLLTLPLEPVHRITFTPRLLVSLAVTSVLGTAAAFTIQSYAQQHLRATETAVILTLEPVFATLAAFLFLNEHLTLRALTGALLILASIALVELAPGLIRAPEIPA